jgi:hypothetical protein
VKEKFDLGAMEQATQLVVMTAVSASDRKRAAQAASTVLQIDQTSGLVGGEKTFHFAG